MKRLVESCFHIDTRLLKKDLARARRKEPVEGFLNVVQDNVASVVNYTVEYESEKAYLMIVFGIEPQKILLSEENLTFGTRTYFTCGCGLRTNSLYLHKNIFACRKCHGLCYASTTINKTSKHGKFLYQQNQIIKLMQERESMGRIFYRSQYTQRFNRWLELCGRAGLKKETEDAQRLMVAISG